MKEIKEQEKMRKKLRAQKEWPRRKLKLLATIFAFAFLTVYFGAKHYKDIAMSKKIREANAELKLDDKRVSDLEAEKIKLRDPLYLKEQARKDLYMMKEDEVHIQITTKKKDADTPEKKQ